LDDARARELLAQQREEIERELANRRQDERTDADEQTVDADAGLQDEEVAEGIADDLRANLEAIERAEKRIDEGTYGKSIESGEPIPDDRLEAIPWAERTAEEQGRQGSRR
jgi:DnaK suppressor protein